MKGKLRTLVALMMTAMMLTSCGGNSGTTTSGSGSQASGSATVSADPITLRPNPNGGVQLNLRSDVMAQFGDAIRDTVMEELKKFDLNDVVVDVEDKGALDFVIRSRLQCAICRGAEISYNWAEEDGHGKQ